jgi:hypothetical protein
MTSEDDESISHYLKEIKKLNARLYNALETYTEEDRIHDIKVLIYKLNKLMKLIKSMK